MPSKGMSAGIAVALSVLLVAVALQAVSVRDLSAGDVRSARLVGALARKVPIDIPGWQAKDEPLGASELMRGQVASILNYDDYVYRIYTKGDIRVGFYVAYWRRDRMPVSRVASHTPDRCWTENGWRCETMGFNQVVVLSDKSVLQHAQTRVFVSPSNLSENVLFWHLVDGKAFDFGERFTSFTHPEKWLRDTLVYATMGSAEQYFIRLTSNRPFEELRNDLGWDALLRSVAKLGLVERFTSG